MRLKKGLNFFFAIIAIIVGTKLYSHFDFQTSTFEKPAIDTLYGVTLALSIFVLIKDFIKKPKE